MENNEHVHAVMWAARRSGLYYTLVNTHLTASEIAYIVDDCGAKALISSAAMRAVCQQLSSQLIRGLPAVALLADAEVEGWQRYPECVAGEPPVPIADECDGQLLQYSAGSTGRPKGIRRPMSATTSAGVTSLSTPVFEALGVGADSVYLSPAPTYHTAPAMWSMCAQAVGATTVMMERFDAEQALECRTAVRSYTRTVRSHDVRPHVAVARLDADGFRPVHIAAGGPCGSAVSARDQAADDRLVGPDHRRVLRLV